MEIKKVNLNNKVYEFVNESGSTRHGFYHKSTLFVNDYEESTNRVSYLNRTWECYRYQTCMKGLVSNLIHNRREKLLRDFKLEKDYKKMTEARNKEFENYLLKDKLTLEYKDLYNSL